MFPWPEGAEQVAINRGAAVSWREDMRTHLLGHAIRPVPCRPLRVCKIAWWGLVRFLRGVRLVYQMQPKATVRRVPWLFVNVTRDLCVGVGIC
jgi:hypothetical protein